jgi:hypothetical protein
MQFDIIESARAHYNAYAAKIGFSIKSHTSKRKAHTNELKKQQFVCNKFRKPKTWKRGKKNNLITERKQQNINDRGNSVNHSIQLAQCEAHTEKIKKNETNRKTNLITFRCELEHTDKGN